MLQSILHFPEEVALQLSEVEYNLFYSVSPIDYIRHLTTNLNVCDENKETINYSQYFLGADLSGFANLRGAGGGGGGGGAGGGGGQNKEFEPLKVTVQDLVKRFNEVKYCNYFAFSNFHHKM